MAIKIWVLPRDASPRLQAIQIAQLSIVVLTGLATFFAAVVPHKSKAFTFSLLYSLIFSSITTTVFLRKEQVAASKGLLSKNKYVKYQLFKMMAAFGMYTLGFFASALVAHGDAKLQNGESGFIMNGYRVTKWQGLIIWISAFNWVFLWAGLFYSCCMSGNKQGAIALTGEEANIGVEDDASNNEALARRLQSEDSN